MRKLTTLFEREQAPSSRHFLATTKVEPGCEWVIDGEGVPTEKFDGSACLFLNGALYARHRAKEGKPIPPGWIHWNFDEPEKSGHGWRPVGDGPGDVWHREAFRLSVPDLMRDGATYELVGPSIQKNPYALTEHQLWEHGGAYNLGDIDPPRDFDGLKKWMESNYAEGIVWHHEDGRMVKLKRRDFGIPWPGKKPTATQ